MKIIRSEGADEMKKQKGPTMVQMREHWEQLDRELSKEALKRPLTRLEHAYIRIRDAQINQHNQEDS